MTPAPAVLVADGNGPSRKLARAVLEHEGFDVIETWKAGDAVAVAIEQRPAAVLLDLRLHRIDAFEALASAPSGGYPAQVTPRKQSAPSRSRKRTVPDSIRGGSRHSPQRSES